MGKRILILDNDPDVLDVVKEVLTYEGFEVDIAAETNDIVSLIGKLQPDLVIIDFWLKGVTGGELCALLKNNALTAGLPIIIFSAGADRHLTTGSYGCDAFIAKPFDLDDLVISVNKLTGALFLNFE